MQKLALCHCFSDSRCQQGTLLTCQMNTPILNQHHQLRWQITESTAIREKYTVLQCVLHRLKKSSTHDDAFAEIKKKICMLLPQFTLPLVPQVQLVPNPPGSFIESFFPSMSWSTRVTGFLTCTLMGMVLNVISIGSFLKLLTGNPSKFAIVYSLGNLLQLFGTAFLVGFQSQLKNMWDLKRRYPVIIFLISTAATIAVPFYDRSLKGVIVAGLLTQWGSFTWYSISYIPFAQTIVRRMVGRFINQ